MESTLFRFIFKFSWRQQIAVLALTLISFPFLYISLDLPKTIINEAIQAKKKFPVEILGVSLDQLGYLALLSALFLLLVCVNGGFKYVINVYKGRLGERMLRRLRYELYARILRFPLGHFRRVSQGELIPMITAECEPLGGFIGDAVAQPIFQAGTMLTIIVFMFIQDPVLGLAAISLYPIQGYIIPKMQRKVNRLGKERVRAVRKLSEQIGEGVSGIQEIHAHDASRLQLARFTDQLGRIYDIRFEIFRRKFLVKFLNNFIGQLTPFFFYSIGGYLVIQGDISFGSLVAVLAAYKDLASPWKELLDYYQQREDNRIKYQQIVEQFNPEGMLDEKLQGREAPAVDRLAGDLQATNLSLVEDDGNVLVDGVSVGVRLDQRIAVVGNESSGKAALAMLLGRLTFPTSGQISIGGSDLAQLPESVTGRRLAYVGPSAYVFSSSLRENLLLGIMYAPLAESPHGDAERARRARLRHEAELTGNSGDDPTAAWIDRSAAGAEDEDALRRRVQELIRGVDLEADVYQIGLRGAVDPNRRPDVAERILAARRALRDRLNVAGIAHLVESFDEGRYNLNATLAENLLFGTPVGPEFDLDKLSDNAYVHSVLDRVGLTDDLISTGRKIAETMVELFADLPADHPFFEQFSFISSDDLPEFQSLLGRVGKGDPKTLAPADRNRLLSLPLKKITARHRLGLIDESMQQRVLTARRAFAEGLPDSLRHAIEFFNSERYNAAASLQDNVLFGKVAYGQAQAAARIGGLIGEVLDALDLRPTVIEVGLDFGVGIGGSRLTQAQRQKLSVARALLRRPDLLVLNEATNTLDGKSQAKVMDTVLKECQGRGLIWVLQRADLARSFDRVLVMKSGRLVEQGQVAELDRAGSAYSELAKAG
jgi:ABC-type multidrug transport system fused ATPase/permease subunit